MRQQPLTRSPPPGLNILMAAKDDSTQTKAERAARERAARRAAMEAKALRDNLARRKAQTRARAAPAAGGPDKCP